MKRHEKNLLLALVIAAGVTPIKIALSALLQLRGEVLRYAILPRGSTRDMIAGSCRQTSSLRRHTQRRSG